jgi:hypothetical protein
MNASGLIVIPKKGEIDLEDGKLHKYQIRHRGREARFMILSAPDGHLTVTLDACAICKPDGYGQAQGAVLCYYCKTLIPLETVGKPGGCNPVPVPFEIGANGVTLDAMTILNRWSETVTTTSRIKVGTWILSALHRNPGIIAKAAEQSGDAAKARQHYAAVVALTEAADPVRVEVAQARAFVEKTR